LRYRYMLTQLLGSFSLLAKDFGLLLFVAVKPYQLQDRWLTSMV
jgi:hypothetical protein